MSIRTTLTLDDDVCAELKRRSRETGQSFRDIVNLVIRRGLTTDVREREQLTVPTFTLGLNPAYQGLPPSEILDQMDIHSFSAKSDSGK